MSFLHSAASEAGRIRSTRSPLAMLAALILLFAAARVSAQVPLPQGIFPSSPTVIDILTGGRSNPFATHGLALLSDATVVSWGHNSLGELGIPSESPFRKTTPLRVLGLSSFIQVVGGSRYSVVCFHQAANRLSNEPTSPAEGRLR